MSMAMFGLVDRALAERETRVLIFLPGNEHGVPPDEYGLVEMYCDERECNCRRVMIAVYSRHPVRQVATINHAFDPPAAGDSMPQTFLDRLNSQSQLRVKVALRVLDRSPPVSAPRFTRRQGQFLAFIRRYTDRYGQPPAEADMARHFMIWPESAHQMVVTLERRGLIAREPGKARSIRVPLSAAELPELE